MIIVKEKGAGIIERTYVLRGEWIMSKKGSVIDTKISKDEMIDIFEDFCSNPYRTLIDIFPEQVGSSSKNYWDVHDYLIDNEFENFVNKAFNIIVKFICYHEYKYIITRTYTGEDTKYNAYSYVSINDLKTMLFKIANGDISTFSIYFETLDILLSLDNDSILIYIEGLKDDNNAFGVLEKLSVSEGLFIKSVFDTTINDGPKVSD